MRLNVLGTTLLPYIPDCTFTDEEKPLCVTITDGFRDWALQNGFSEHVTGVEIGCRVKLPVDLWIKAYMDGIAPPLSAKHSHERAIYWFPLELFNDIEDTDGKA